MGPPRAFSSSIVGKMLQSDTADSVVGPLSLVLGDETILEEAQSLVSPDADKTFHGQGFKGSNGLVDTTHPPSQLTRTVDIVRLDLVA